MSRWDRYGTGWALTRSRQWYPAVPTPPPTFFPTPDFMATSPIWPPRKRVFTMTGAPTKSIGGTQFVGGEGSTSYWVHNRQASDLVRRQLDTLVGPMIWRADKGECLSSTVGKQNWHVVAYLGEYNDLMALINYTATAYAEFDSTTSDNATRESAYIYVQDIDATSEICNMSNTSTWITIYDLTKSQNDRLEVAGSEAQIFNPEQTWQKGVDEQRFSSGTDVLDPSYVGAIPTDSKRFSQEWHIHQTTRICLGPGDIHQHHVRYGVNSFISPSDLQRANAGETGYTQIATFLKGTSYCMMLVHHGQVCANADGTEATYGKSDLCVVTHRRYKWKYAMKDIAFRAGTTTLDTTAATNVINQRVGNVEPYEDAVP